MTFIHARLMNDDTSGSDSIGQNRTAHEIVGTSLNLGHVGRIVISHQIHLSVLRSVFSPARRHVLPWRERGDR